ncbi:MAG: hypothetical protein E6Q77_08865 [Rhizobium sp.]|nr:MAG: hypothetical protein E6Q77_08865 [Rhizobium sp.]
MTARSKTGDTLAIVDAYYQAGVEKRLTDFAPYLHPDFITTAPNYLPWGGVHHGGAFFRDQVLPNLPDVLDFGRFSYDVFFADGEKAVALCNFGLTGRDDMIKIPNTGQSAMASRSTYGWHISNPKPCWRA